MRSIEVNAAKAVHRSKGGSTAALLFSFFFGCSGAAPHEAQSPHAQSPHAQSPHAQSPHAQSPHAQSPHGHHHGALPSAPASIDDELSEVARIHGAAGPWAVAGYRMGKYAMTRLGAPRQSLDLEVIHHSPREVQFSCIADGASAATGASMGKLNLTLAEADEAHIATTYRRKSTGASVTLRPSAAFVARFRDVPREKLPAAGRSVMELSDADVFEEVPALR
jgi:hypothetical protein